MPGCSRATRPASCMPPSAEAVGHHHGGPGGVRRGHARPAWPAAGLATARLAQSPRGSASTSGAGEVARYSRRRSSARRSSSSTRSTGSGPAGCLDRRPGAVAAGVPVGRHGRGPRPRPVPAVPRPGGPARAGWPGPACCPRTAATAGPPVRKTWSSSADAVDFVAAQRILEPLAGRCRVPAAPVVGVPGVIDPGHQMRLPVRIGPVAAQDRSRAAARTASFSGHVVAQCVQPAAARSRASPR